MLNVSHFHIFSKCNEILHIVHYLVLCSGGLLEKVVVSHWLKKFLTFVELEGSSARTHHWPQFLVRWIHITPSHYVNLRSSYILSSHLCLGLPGSLCPSGLWPAFCTKLWSVPCMTHSLPFRCLRFQYPNNVWLGTAVAQWLRCCATNQKVAGLIPGGFHWHNPSDRTMALGLTEPLTEMSTGRIFWGVNVASA